MESKTYFKDNNHLQNVEKLAEAIAQSDAILVGAAAGMSAACGFDFFYSNDAMFRKYLGEFGAKYGYVGAFNGFYYRYPSSEARWAFLARMCYMEYECPTGQPYYDLMNLLVSVEAYTLYKLKCEVISLIGEDEKYGRAFWMHCWKGGNGSGQTDSKTNVSGKAENGGADHADGDAMACVRLVPHRPGTLRDREPA